MLVPGAILGLGLTLARPRTRGELAFGAMTLLVPRFLLVEAGLFGDVDAGPGALRLLRRAAGGPLLRPVRLSGLAVPPLPRAHRGQARDRGRAVVPLAGYTAADEKAHSALLYGVFRIEQWLGTPGNGSIAIALAGDRWRRPSSSSFRGRASRPRQLWPWRSRVSAGFSAAAVVFDLGEHPLGAQVLLARRPLVGRPRRGR